MSSSVVLISDWNPKWLKQLEIMGLNKVNNEMQETVDSAMNQETNGLMHFTAKDLLEPVIPNKGPDRDGDCEYYMLSIGPRDTGIIGCPEVHSAAFEAADTRRLAYNLLKRQVSREGGEKIEQRNRSTTVVTLGGNPGVPFIAKGKCNDFESGSGYIDEFRHSETTNNCAFVLGNSCDGLRTEWTTEVRSCTDGASISHKLCMRHNGQAEREEAGMECSIGELFSPDWRVLKATRRDAYVCLLLFGAPSVQQKRRPTMEPGGDEAWEYGGDDSEED
ncbi:hypothetical protein B0H17DRAFT_1150000 [Mycena rosella]|uniref:Uncharacterized protein n=1 Tax=Mycena rosella TaxID=1033263 RepID=A0AAD7BVD7_MYCRO|nr:hypothetical protein B0H17DRAFT_1150000 [Mycena rosella]